MTIKKSLYKLEKLIFSMSRNLPPIEKKAVCSSTAIRFSPLECKNMPKSFKREFTRYRLIARVLKYSNGYEIRFMHNGYSRVAFHENLEEAKKIFVSM